PPSAHLASPTSPPPARLKAPHQLGRIGIQATDEPNASVTLSIAPPDGPEGTQWRSEQPSRVRLDLQRRIGRRRAGRFHRSFATTTASWCAGSPFNWAIIRMPARLRKI